MGNILMLDRIKSWILTWILASKPIKDNGILYKTITEYPAAHIQELQIGVIKVELLIPNLKPAPDKSYTNIGNGKVKFSWINRCGFKVRATVVEGNTYKVWLYTVKKLPSDIVVEHSSWKCLNGKIQIMLHTNEKFSWMPFIFNHGLCQFSDDEEDDEI